uniref:Fatty acyl-CoA reductase n=1 Tax=Timema shepardi TaxID=629360 RepID=A0A7R9AT96_TIMSH|nr:unnamed protein product [Timema shepardi]
MEQATSSTARLVAHLVGVSGTKSKSRALVLCHCAGCPGPKCPIRLPAPSKEGSQRQEVSYGEHNMWLGAELKNETSVPIGARDVNREDRLFSRLKEEVPKFRHRVVAVSGDCALPGLGLSETDRLKLVDQVNIVFHGAATVRFDERIDVAVGINATGTKNMLELARNMIGLKAFIHVSTAYAHCTLSRIEEKFYPSPHSFDQLMATIQNLTDQELEKIMPELLNNIPNTYVYTKAIAESIIKEEAGNLPIGVFRPAIVIGTRSEPLPGWIDNVYGPTGIVVGAGIGILRTINVDPCISANLVPVDMAVGALIASAREVHNTQRKLGDTEGIPIYNYVSSAQKPIQWQEFVEMAGNHGMDIPCSKAIWYYSVTMTKYKVLYIILSFLLHTLPALLVDTVTILCFKKPK